MTDSDTITGLLISSIEHTWNAIRDHHPDIPNVVVTLGSGSLGGQLTLGHFAPHRWIRGEYHLHELFIGGEGLDRGPTDVLTTVLHEAAHSLAATRGIRDTSRQGRWHNTTYRNHAHELGLTTTHHPHAGWAITTIPPHTQHTYRHQLDELALALIAHRRREPRPHPGRKSNNNGITATCACPRKIRASPTSYHTGPIYCAVCGMPFEQ